MTQYSKRKSNKKLKKSQKNKSKKSSGKNKGRTLIDHGSIESWLKFLLPWILKLSGVSRNSIFKSTWNQVNSYTNKHRKKYEYETDLHDEVNETEEDFIETKKKLKAQEPDQLIDEDKLHWLQKLGLVICSFLLAASFTATITVTSVYIQAYSTAGKWAASISIGLIAAFGAILLKWTANYPLRNFKQQFEIAMVPCAFLAFGLFVYQMTDLYFWMDQTVSGASKEPDWNAVMNGSSDSAGSSEKTDGRISLKWFYIGVLATEMFASYALMSFIVSCATPQLKLVVKAIKDQLDKMAGPRHRNRKVIRSARMESADLQYLASLSEAPGKLIRQLFKKFTQK